jgi:hypothetical protein
MVGDTLALVFFTGFFLTVSAADRSTLFVGFTATMAKSDF